MAEVTHLLGGLVISEREGFEPLVTNYLAEFR